MIRAITEEDADILRALKARESAELVAFRAKIKNVRTPRAHAIRRHILRVLISRHPLDMDSMLDLSSADRAEFMQVATQVRVERLESGDYRFGCTVTHRGQGTSYCPLEPHHHHDVFCKTPTKAELEAAGIDPKAFRRKGRHEYQELASSL